MTHEQKIQFIADRCAIANPRLKELVMGCRGLYKFWQEDKVTYVSEAIYLYSDGLRHYVRVEIDNSNHFFTEKKGFEIIGREPQLFDCSLLNGIDKHWLIDNWCIGGLREQNEDFISKLYSQIK